MNTGFPDPETVRTALALASRAPSVHNTQPWRWRIDPAGLHLYADPARQLPHTDPDGRDLILSCGIALQHCVTAFAAVGWRSRVRRLPDPDDPDHLATLEFSPQTADYVDVALAAAIPRRRTDRRHYSWVPVGDIALMAARAARAGVTLYQVQDVDGLHDIVAQSIRDHLTQDYLAELTTWSGRYFSVSGVPARNTPFPDPAAKIPTRLFAGAALPMAQGSSAADDNAVVGWPAARSPNRWRRRRRARRCAPTSSVTATIRRCCCGWVGRRSTRTRCRRPRAATSPTSSSGSADQPAGDPNRKRRPVTLSGTMRT